MYLVDEQGGKIPLQIRAGSVWTGPEGGADGGRIVAEGTPAEVARVAGSHTGRALRSVIA